MSLHRRSFDNAQRNRDFQEAPEYWEDGKEEPEVFDYIVSTYEKSDLMETWSFSMMMIKNVTSGVYSIDLGEFSGSGQSKDEALKDLCEQIAGDLIGVSDVIAAMICAPIS